MVSKIWLSWFQEDKEERSVVLHAPLPTRTGGKYPWGQQQQCLELSNPFFTFHFPASHTARYWAPLRLGFMQLSCISPF